VKTRRCRTLINTTADGRSIKLTDPGAGAVTWQLSYSGLVDAERSAIEDFFREAEGSLQSFVFLDPVGNLLTWSEKLDEAVWERGPLLSVTGGQADPFGTSRASAVRNTGGGTQSLQQTLKAPANYVYAFSLHARAETPTDLTLFRGTDRQRMTATRDWSRLTLSGQSAATGDSVIFGLELPAGSAVAVFGLQAEAQPGASRYQSTQGQSGVYDARFQDDVLAFTTTAPERHACTVNIIHANHL
jgi:hypothetical protein